MLKTILCLMFLLFVGFVFSTRTVAADDLHSYINYNTIVDGESVVEIPGSKTKKDLSGTVLKGGVSYARWKFSAEYHDGEIGLDDYELLYLQGGYRVIDAYASKVDLMLGSLNIKTDTTELDNLLFVAEYTQFFSKRFGMTASLGYSLDGSHKLGTIKDKDVDSTIFRVNCNIIFTEKLIGNIVYTNLNYGFYHPVASADADVTLSAWSLGLTYRF